MNNAPRVALSADFLMAFARLPKAQQKKVREFTEKFREDPLQPSIHYERIHAMRDDKVRTVRVDQAYRAIVVHPPKGDVFLLVWVDHHDEAMAWAKNKIFEVNPVVGSLQVYEVAEGAAAPSKQETKAAEAEDRVPEGRLFAGVAHESLLLCGVPEPLLPAVRALRTEKDLDALAPHMPGEASDALYMLAAGGSVEEAMDAAGQRRKAAAVDPKSFAAALENPASLRKFNVIESERQLLEMLNAPLALWRIFLHPSQRSLVRMGARGPARVLGGPGTGKTVVAMHRARYLATEVFTREEDRILVTTFTRNLASDIEKQLEALLGDDKARDRVEVTNLDQWGVKFLKSQKVRVEVASEEERRDLWESAFRRIGTLSFPESFYKDEWERVVQAQSILERDDYLRAKRTGRGTAVSRAQRAAIWEVMAAYRAALEGSQKLEHADILREARLLLERPERRGSLPYRAVVADEVQDLGLPALKLLRAIVPPGDNDLFLVGDAHQRIYGAPISLSAAGIETRGRSKRMLLNYRTTKEVRDWAVGVLAGQAVDDLDEGEDTLRGYRSLRTGAAPTVKHFRTPEEETRFIVETLKTWRKAGKLEEIGIAACTRNLIEKRYEPLLRDADIPCHVLDRKADDPKIPGVRLATMHRVKGLEFPRVMLVGVQAGVMPKEFAGASGADETTQAEHLEQERRLLFVAATRARDELVVTGFGRKSPFLEGAG